MTSLIKEKGTKIKDFLENAGLLFPKEKRAPRNRRCGGDNRFFVIENYLVVGGYEKRSGIERRQHDRRE